MMNLASLYFLANNQAFLRGFFLHLKRRGYWEEFFYHLLGARRELRFSVHFLLRSLYEAALPYAETDPIATVLCEVLRFVERHTASIHVQEVKPLSFDLLQQKKRLLQQLRVLLLNQIQEVLPDKNMQQMRKKMLEQMMQLLDQEEAKEVERI